MASSSPQILKYNLSALPLSHHQRNFPGKSSWLFPEHSPSRKKSVFALRRISNGSRNLARKRFSVICLAQDSDKENNGEEPPESLFMKELRRRGMSPTSLLEETNTSDYGGESVAFSQRNAVSTEVEKSLFNQRERSMMLNSEGLEGLFPRAKVLVTLGGTFFFGFWPLILVTIALFTALYFYFGTAFVHDGSKIPVLPPQYIDPYALLEEERISHMAPSVN